MVVVIELGAYIHGVLTFNGCLLSRFYSIFMWYSLREWVQIMGMGPWGIHYGKAPLKFLAGCHSLASDDSESALQLLSILLQLYSEIQEAANCGL